MRNNSTDLQNFFPATNQRLFDHVERLGKDKLKSQYLTFNI